MVKPVDGMAKEPLMGAPSGHGYLGTLLYDDVADKVQCHECGDWFNSVAAHIRFHGIRSRDYKEKYELNYSTPLSTQAVSQKASIRAEFMYRLNHEKVSLLEIKERAHKMSAKSKALRKKLRKKNRLTVEMMNKFGSCPRQVEERFIQAVEKIGHTPSWDELYKYDASLLSVLYRRFKGYSNALQYFGLKSKRRVTFKEYGKEGIENALRSFVDEFRRLPNPKDTKLGYLPDYQTITRYFGKWAVGKRWAFNYLKKNYPKDAMVYDEKLKRMMVQPPFMREPKRKIYAPASM